METLKHSNRRKEQNPTQKGSSHLPEASSGKRSNEEKRRWRKRENRWRRANRRREDRRSRYTLQHMHADVLSYGLVLLLSGS